MMACVTDTVTWVCCFQPKRKKNEYCHTFIKNEKYSKHILILQENHDSSEEFAYFIEFFLNFKKLFKKDIFYQLIWFYLFLLLLKLTTKPRRNAFSTRSRKKNNVSDH